MQDWTTGLEDNGQPRLPQLAMGDNIALAITTIVLRGGNGWFPEEDFGDTAR